MDRINTFLERLAIPITLSSPTDLTPLLLIAILEEALRRRIDLTPPARACRTQRGRVEAMKVFLGVLLDDVLSLDGYIDPQRLAEGAATETQTIVHLLVLMAERLGFLDSLVSAAPSEIGDTTRLHSMSEIAGDDELDVMYTAHRSNAPSPPSYSQAELSTYGRSASEVRYDGWIDEVDEEQELVNFEATRSNVSYSRGDITVEMSIPRTPSPSPLSSARHTLELLERKADLLESLIRARGMRPSP